VIGWLWCATAGATIALDRPPAVGQETIIAVEDDAGLGRGGETVRVVHRPGLSGERELAIGITDGRGRVRWTPTTPGIARLRAGEEPLIIRVDHRERPLGIPLLLALLAAGGVAALTGGLGLPRRRA